MFYQIAFWLQKKIKNIIGGFALNSWFYVLSSHKLSSNFPRAWFIYVLREMITYTEYEPAAPYKMPPFLVNV